MDLFYSEEHLGKLENPGYAVDNFPLHKQFLELREEAEIVFPCLSVWNLILQSRNKSSLRKLRRCSSYQETLSVNLKGLQIALLFSLFNTITSLRKWLDAMAEKEFPWHFRYFILTRSPESHNIAKIIIYHATNQTVLRLELEDRTGPNC